MFQRMLASALFAGAAAGLIAAVLHVAFVQQLILLSEQYESGSLTHFTTGSASAEAGLSGDATHSHDAETEGSAHAHEAPEPVSDLRRNGLTVLFMGLVYISYGMLLTAGFGMAEGAGQRIGPAQGLLWGLGGFVAFQLAPAIGLAPELPGTVAAELGARQIWWWSTVALTATAIALIAYGRHLWMFALAVVLLAAPHVIGAPQADAFFGVSPPEVAAAFTARVLGTGLVVWACLGWLAGYFWNRKPFA